MRVSTSMMQRMAVEAMTDRQGDLSNTQLQLASGKRLNNPSDDPAGATQMLLLNQKLALNKQYQSNTNSALTRLEAEEQVLDAAGDSLQRIRELAVRGINGTLGPDNRQAIAEEVKQRLDELVDLANSKDGSGDYIFGGFQVKDPPVHDSGTGIYTYMGDQGQRMIQISPTRQIAVNDSGAEIFIGLDYSGGGKQDIFKTIFDFANGLESNLPTDYVGGDAPFSSALAVGQQGVGIDSGSNITAGDLNIAIGDQDPVAIGPSTDSSVGFGNAGRTSNSAYAKAEAITNSAVPGLTATADTTVVFDYVPVTNTAANYSLTINGANIYAIDGNAISGSQMASRINTFTSTTGVTASFDAGNGRITLNAADGRNISIDQTTGASVDGLGQGLAATTAGLNNDTNDAADVITTTTGIPSSHTFVGTIRLKSSDRITLSGNNEATIGYPDGAVMTNAGNVLDDIDVALDKFFSVRAQIGARINVLESQSSINEQYSVQLESAVSEIRDLDYAEAIGRLNLQLVGLQASQQAFQKIQNLSLFNYL